MYTHDTCTNASILLPYRLDDFSPLSPPPHQHLQIYTWPTCTLRELSHLLVSALPSLLPNPAVGTRLAYRLIYPSPQTPPPSAPEGMGRYVSKDVGSLVVSADDEGGHDEEIDDRERERGESRRMKPTEEEAKILGPEGVMTGALSGSPDKTLQDARFVVGDYISCCILPPLSDGSVAPVPPPPGDGRGASGPYMNGGGRGGGYGGSAPPLRENGYGPSGGGYRGRGGRSGGYRPEPGRLGEGVPSGEWRRGERIPDSRGGFRGRGRGYW